MSLLYDLQLGNFAKGTISGSFGTSDTTLYLTTGNGARMPATPFRMVVWNSTDYMDPTDAWIQNPMQIELMDVTNRSGDALTVTRGAEDSSFQISSQAGKTYSVIVPITSAKLMSINRMIVDSWYKDNVAASISTPTALSRFAAGVEPTAFIAPKDGSITGIAVYSNAPRTGGSLTVEAYIGAVATGLQAVLNGSNTTFHAMPQEKDADQFSAGDLIYVKVTTTTDWLPDGSADIRAILELEW